MDSSKRHWPSMFKSKPSVNSHLHQWQHDISPLISTAAATNSLRPYITSSVVSEERTPDPKPRWNPKPEQIRILEGIFNSGMVNPPREEIRRIRAQLQEYGQVGDANVFYWFQNRKSRSKTKKNNPQNTHTKSHTKSLSPHAKTSSPSSAAAAAHPLSFSSSSSSDKSSAEKKDFSSNVLDGLNSPTCSVNQPYFRTTTSTGGFLPEPYLFPASQSRLVGGGTQQGFFLPELVSSNDYVGHNNYVSHGQTSSGNCSAGLLLTDLMNLGAMNDYYKRAEDNDKVYTQLSYSGVTTTTTAATPTISAQTILHPTISPTLMSTINHTQGQEVVKKSTVFINDVAIEVASGPFDVREAFGDDAVLINSSGQPVLTNEWGVTLHSLQHGSFYYLVRMLTPPHTSMHLI